MWLCCWQRQPNLTLCGLLEHSLLTPTRKIYSKKFSLKFGQNKQLPLFPENYCLKHFLVCQLLLKFLNTKVSQLLNSEELLMGVPSSYSSSIPHNFILIKSYISFTLGHMFPWLVLDRFNGLFNDSSPSKPCGTPLDLSSSTYVCATIPEYEP